MLHEEDPSTFRSSGQAPITKEIQEKKYVMLYASSRIDSHISAACYKVSILPEKLY